MNSIAIWFAVLAASASLAAAQDAHSPQNTIVVGAGNDLRCRLEKGLRITKSGEPITAKLLETVYAGTTIAIPEGSTVKGHVSSISSAPGHKGHLLRGDFTRPRTAHVTFDSVILVPDVSVAFITRSETNTVDVFDPRSLQQLASIPVADDADAILYIPSTKLVYVAHGDANMATLIDPQKRATVGTIQLPGKPEFPAMDSRSGLLFQNLEDTNAVVAIDVGNRSVVGQWPLAPCEGPSGMAIDAEQRRLFAVCSGNAKLVVFNLESHRVITSFEIGGGPDSVAFDRGVHRIYAAGKAGKLTVIQQDDPDNYRVLDEIRTHYGAHTLTVDPVSHKVFVAYASLIVHPRIAVFSPTGTAPEVNVAPVIQQDVHEENDLSSPPALGQLFDIRLTTLDDQDPHH